MADIIDINVNETTEEVTINVVNDVIQVNINKVTNTAGVPYVGATQDVNLGEFGLLTGNIELDNTPTNIPTAAGSIYWNDSDGTADLILKGGNVKLQLGQEQVIRVVNKTATNINLLESNYQAVRVTGAQGQRLKVDLAQATNDLLSAETIGLVTETINNNQEGFITTSGLVRNINTTGSLQSETWADGDILYLSPTVAGRITKVKPIAPNHLVIIGYVIHAHATQGSIFVKVDNGYELDELHNVKIDTPLNNEGLIYNSTLQVWENKSIDLESVLTEDNESTTQDAIFRLDADKYLKINRASQKIELWDESIDDTIPITHWDKDSFYIKDAFGNQMSISAGYTNNLTTDGSSCEIFGGNITLNQTGSSLNLISEAVQITVGLDSTQYFYDKITVNGVDYALPTGASSQIATLLDIPAPITIDATPTDGSSNAVSSNGVFDALALKQNSSTAIVDIFEKAIIKDNYFWVTPSAIANTNIFGLSTNSLGQTFTFAGNVAGSKGMPLFASTAVAGTVAFKRRNDAWQFQGFIMSFKQKIQFQTNISGQRFFHGLTKGNQFTAPTNVDQTTLTNIVGVCQLSTSTNMHVIHNDASGTATTIDLGVNYPCNDSQYNYFITIEQNALNYAVTVERVTVATGASISTTNTLTTNIMDYTTGVIQICTWITNNATASIASYLDGGLIGKFNN